MLGQKQPLIEDDHWSIFKIDDDDLFTCSEIQGFDCDDEDLNDFFRNEAAAHKKELFAESYFVQPRRATEGDLFTPVALFSLSNDSILHTREQRQTALRDFLKKIKKTVPHPKYLYKHLPAVKIGRLGVYKDYKRQGIGTGSMNLIKEMIIQAPVSARRFLVVDAYNTGEAIDFYIKNGFDFLHDNDVDSDTRLMWFDLKRHQIG